jgi:hypothetical protein
MIDFSLSEVVQRHRHFRPGRAHASDVSLFGFQVGHFVHHFVSVSAIFFCVNNFVSVSAILFLCPPFVSVSAILLPCPSFCFCVRHFVSVSTILFLCQPLHFWCRHFDFRLFVLPRQIPDLSTALSQLRVFSSEI